MPDLDLDLTQLFSPEHQALALQILAVLTVAMPLLERAAHATANTVDDKFVRWLKAALSYVPRVRLGGQK